MTQEQIARLFQPFEQADGSITKRFGGTGLGLAISKNIIEQMNGRVWVESELGTGSAFIFDVALGPLLHDEVNNSFESAEPSKIKLLVVEGDNAALDDFCTIVHQFGMDCNHSSSAQHALERINKAYEENIPYDLLFISSQLLNIEGSEMLSQLKGKIDENAVIVLAENAERESIQTLAHSYGIYKSIAKPVLASEILNVISEIMGTSINKHNIEPVAVKALPDFSRLNLLLVEDVEINQEIFISLLEDTGLHIDVANNGLEAVEKFSQNPELYAIIIMDLQMPQMDGYEATKLIRLMEHPRAKTIPIVAMTANAFKEDIDKCLAIGMNDHVSKPIDEKIVMEKILLFTQAGQNVLL